MFSVIASPRESSARIRRFGLVGNMSSSVIGSGVYSACQWCVLVTIAHLGSRAMLGQYALALAITTPVFALTSLNARAVQASDTAQEYPFRAYLSLRFVTTAVALAIVLITVACWGLTAAGIRVVLLVALAKAVDAVTECYYARLQQLEAMFECAAGAIVNGMSTLIVGATLLAVTGSIGWLAGGSL